MEIIAIPSKSQPWFCKAQVLELPEPYASRDLNCIPGHKLSTLSPIFGYRFGQKVRSIWNAITKRWEKPILVLAQCVWARSVVTTTATRRFWSRANYRATSLEGHLNNSQTDRAKALFKQVNNLTKAFNIELEKIGMEKPSNIAIIEIKYLLWAECVRFHSHTKIHNNILLSK